MASRPSHIYASTLTRRERAWGRSRRRRLSAFAPALAITASALLGVLIQHIA